MNTSHLRWFALACFGLLCSAPVFAQSEPVVLRVSTALDGHGHVLHDTSIVVQNGKIVRIDPKATGKGYDLRGLTVMPGWIDTHVHITRGFAPDGRIPIARTHRRRNTPSSLRRPMRGKRSWTASPPFRASAHRMI